MTATGRLLLLGILQDDRRLYGVERLFDRQQFENFELAESAKTGQTTFELNGVIRRPMEGQRPIVSLIRFH